jgi:hypothetical protein
MLVELDGGCPWARYQGYNDPNTPNKASKGGAKKASYCLGFLFIRAQILAPPLTRSMSGPLRRVALTSRYIYNLAERQGGPGGGVWHYYLIKQAQTHAHIHPIRRNAPPIFYSELKHATKELSGTSRSRTSSLTYTHRRAPSSPLRLLRAWWSSSLPPSHLEKNNRQNGPPSFPPSTPAPEYTPSPSPRI